MATLSVGILASASSLQLALAANGVVTTVAAAPTFALTGSAAAVPPPSAAPSPPASDAPDSSSSGGSSAAVIIAVAIIAALLLAATAALLLRRARRARAKAPGGVVEATEAVVSKHGQSSISVDEIELASPSRNARKEARLHHWKIEPGELEWEIGRELGRGAFGSVFKVYYNDQPYAAKKMDVGVGARERPEVVDLLTTEFSSLHAIIHPNVVRVLGVILDEPTYLAMVMELADLGSLRQMLDDDGERIRSQPALQLSIAHDICAGMAHLHAKKPKPIMHNDLKSANILLCSSGGTSQHLVAKISDFGIASGLEMTRFGESKTATRAKEGGRGGGGGGTFAYRAPETFSNDNELASEVYAFGIISWELLTLSRPWFRDESGKRYNEGAVMKKVVIDEERPPLPPRPTTEGPSTFLHDMTTRSWVQEPSERPTFAALLEEIRPALERANVKAEAPLVFLSYRVASDAALVEVLHDKLTMRGVRVWWDRKCLLPGQPWEEGFADGLFASSVFVPVLSKAGLKNFGELTAGSWCDNVLLEHRMALELKHRGGIKLIQPVMVGEVQQLGSIGEGFGNFFADQGRPNCPEIVVNAVEEKLAEHLRRGGKGDAQTAPQTVKEVLDTVLSHQGVALSGARSVAIELVVDEIVRAVDMLHAQNEADLRI